MTACDMCCGEAVYTRSYSGEHLCGSCYTASIEKRVQHTISRHKMLEPKDKVALALSGGKDSVSMLHILCKLEKHFPMSSMVAVTVDEGIDDYRREAIEIAVENCRRQGVQHRVYSFKDIYGYTLDEVAEAARKIGKSFICSYCGILRRKALNLAAKKLGATKLATAHNLDDEVQSTIMNFLRGDLASIRRGKSEAEEVDGLVPRVKPLCEVPEREVALYAHFKGIRLQSLCCGYLESSLRSDVRRFLNELEEKHAGMKFSAYRSFEKVKPLLESQERRGVGLCSVCGEPAAGEICMACQILGEFGLK